MGNNTGGTLRHQLTLRDDQKGDYIITLRYTNSTKAGKMRATVNGKNILVSLEKTDVNEWKKVSFNATMKAGKNNLLITNTGGVTSYLDQVIYTPAGTAPEQYEIFVRKANYGSLTPLVSEAAEGDTVYVEVTANKGYGLKELAVVNGVNFTMGTKINLETLENGNTLLSFVMPDDIVTLKPTFAKGVNTVDGITITEADGTQTTAVYGLGGERRANTSRGINIIRTSDGKTRKVLVK